MAPLVQPPEDDGPPPRSQRRAGGRPVSLSAAAAVLTAVHGAYEAAAGTGFPTQSTLGLRGAAAAHVGATAAWVWVAERRHDPRGRRLAAALDGVAVASALTHFVAWPATWRFGVPVLQTGAEGMSAPWARGYTALLHCWAAVAALAVARDVPAPHRRWALAGVAAAPLVALASHRELRWVREEAAVSVRWWNRALAEDHQSALT